MGIYFKYVLLIFLPIVSYCSDVPRENSCKRSGSDIELFACIPQKKYADKCEFLKSGDILTCVKLLEHFEGQEFSNAICLLSDRLHKLSIQDFVEHVDSLFALSEDENIKIFIEHLFFIPNNKTIFYSRVGKELCWNIIFNHNSLFFLSLLEKYRKDFFSHEIPNFYERIITAYHNGNKELILRIFNNIRLPKKILSYVNNKGESFFDHIYFNQDFEFLSALFESAINQESCLYLDWDILNKLFIYDDLDLFKHFFSLLSEQQILSYFKENGSLLEFNINSKQIINYLFNDCFDLIVKSKLSGLIVECSKIYKHACIQKILNLDANNSNILYYATYCADIDLFKSLYEQFPSSIDKIVPDGNSILMAACIVNSYEIVEFLINNNIGCDEHFVINNESTITALDYAYYNNNFELCRLLIGKFPFLLQQRSVSNNIPDFKRRALTPDFIYTNIIEKALFNNPIDLDFLCTKEEFIFVINQDDNKRRFLKIACILKLPNTIKQAISLSLQNLKKIDAIRHFIDYHANKLSFYIAKDMLNFIFSIISIKYASIDGEIVTNDKLSTKLNAYLFHILSDANFSRISSAFDYKKSKKYISLLQYYGHNPIEIINKMHDPFFPGQTNLLLLNFGQEIESPNYNMFFIAIVKLLKTNIMPDIKTKNLYDFIKTNILNLFKENNYEKLCFLNNNIPKEIIDFDRSVSIFNIFFNNNEIIEILLSKISETNNMINILNYFPEFKNIKDVEGKNLLFYAIKYNNYELVKFLIRDNPDSLIHFDNNGEDAFKILLDRPALFKKFMIDLNTKTNI